MDGQKKYTLEQARIGEKKAQCNEVKDVVEAKLQFEADDLIQNSEAILKNFIESELTDLPKSEAWKARLQMNIRNRLADNPDKRYIFGLSQSAKGVEEERTRLVTAAYLYEFEHRNEMPHIPNYNPTVLFRFALDFAKTREDVLGITMKKYLDTVPLAKIYEHFKGAKNSTPQDLPRLAEVALERCLQKDESAQEVLDDARTDLFRPAVNEKEKKLRAESFFMRVGNYDINAERFTPEVLHFLLTSIKKEDPAIFNEVVKRIDSDLERFAQEGIPFDEKEFAQKQAEVQWGDWSKRQYLEKSHHRLVTFHNMTKSVPVIKDAYDEILQKREEERIKALQKKYAELIRTSSIRDLEQLQKSTGIEVDSQIVQQGYTELVKHGDVYEFFRLKDITGIKVDIEPDIVQQGYTAIVRGGRLYNNPIRFQIDRLIALKNFTGVEIDPHIVQQVYTVLIEEGGADFANMMSNVAKSTGVDIDPTVAQEGYNMLICRGEMGKIARFNEMFDLELKIESLDVQAGYRTLLALDLRYGDNRDIDFNGLIKLKEMTGMKIDHELVLRKYAGILEKYLHDEKALSKLIQLHEITGVDFDPVPIQRLFAQLIDGMRIDDLNRLHELTGVELETKTFTAGVKAIWDRQDPQSLKEILEAFPETAIIWQDLHPQIDAGVYESARRISNKDLFEKTWDVLAGKMIKIPKEPETARDVRLTALPPHLYALLKIKKMDLDGLLHQLDSIFANVKAKRSGSSELATKAEFAIVHLTSSATDKELKRIKKNFEQILQFNPEQDITVKIIDTLASLVALSEAIAEGAEEEPPSHGQHLGGGHHLGLGQGLGLHYGQHQTWRDSDEIFRIELRLPNKVENPKAYLDQIEEKQRTIIAKVLGFSPDLADYQRLESEWGTLRPLFVLASKYRNGFPEGMPLFRQTAESFFVDRWKEFRYQNEEAEKLLEGLTADQKDQWIANVEPMSLEEVHVSAIEAESQVVEIRRIVTAGLDNGHLYSAQNPESAWAHDVHLWTRNVLHQAEGYNPDSLKKARLLSGLELYRLTSLPRVMKELGLDSNALPEGILLKTQARTAQIQETLTIKSSAKLKSGLRRMQAATRWAEDMNALGAEIETLRKRLGLRDDTKPETVKNLNSHLQIAEKLLRLANLTPEEIRANALLDEKGELKRGALGEWVAQLAEEFRKKKSVIAQDIENIVEMLKTTGAELKLTGLRIEESDHPKTLLETGKYPSGSGSCQNYEGRIEFNKCLLSYVADADKKIIMVRKPNGTIVARSIVKLVWIEKEPAIFIEPTYTSVNKADHNFDDDFNKYLLKKASRMGSVKVLRGSMQGPIRVRVRTSRNNLQYEDGGSGAADNAGLGIKAGAYSMGALEV
ncbi:MAG: hypothetical protein ABIH21_03715 [Patescibacteria group bacterium]